MTSKKESTVALNFPEFDNIKVSTKTFIAKTNLTLDLEKLFDYLPITEYVVIPKRRGRKKKVEQVDPNKDITPGSIITLKFRDKVRGVDLKAKKNTDKNTHKKRGKWFRNSFTVVLVIENKNINFKVSQNGMFQITGCKFDSNAEECIKYMWEYIKGNKDIYTYQNNAKTLETYYVPAMRNIDFDLGFNVDREKLAEYMNHQTEFHSLLETSFGYTGVNIKIPLTKEISDMSIKKVSYIPPIEPVKKKMIVSPKKCKKKMIVSPKKCKKTKKEAKKVKKVETPVETPKELKSPWVTEMVKYSDYLALLPPKDREKKLNKDRYNTFLVFHSGKVIMSGITADFMRDEYKYFLKIMKTCYHKIREKLNVD